MGDAVAEDIRKQWEAEAQKNYAALKKLSDTRLEVGKFALMKDGKLEDVFDTSNDAFLAGKKLFGDVPFSVQKIQDHAVDQGYFSRAVPERTISA